MIGCIERPQRAWRDLRTHWWTRMGLNPGGVGSLGVLGVSIDATKTRRRPCGWNNSFSRPVQNFQAKTAIEFDCAVAAVWRWKGIWDGLGAVSGVGTITLAYLARGARKRWHTKSPNKRSPLKSSPTLLSAATDTRYIKVRSTLKFSG